MTEEPPVINLRQVMNKRLIITGSTLRGSSYEFKKQLAQEVQAHVWPLIEAGKFRPVIYKIFPLSEATEAHRLPEEGSHTGKIVLEVNA